jgi:hypothetical protein
VAASTFGTGELVAAAVGAGAKRIVLGVGGSATTDGGFGALRALYPLQRLRGLDITVACDVRTRFLDAAKIFAPQKGATPTQVELLTRRLERLAEVYLEDYGVDVRDLEGGGAAGGLAGGLAVIGAELERGFDLVAEEVDLLGHLEGADLVVTGEGFVDAESFDGKVVGGVIGLAGNVSEWTATWDAHPDVPDKRVPLKRGASFATTAGFELTARRAAETPGERNYWTGIRIAADREDPVSMGTAPAAAPVAEEAAPPAPAPARTESAVSPSSQPDPWPPHRASFVTNGNQDNILRDLALDRQSP